MDGLAAMMADDLTWWVAGKPELFPLAGLKTRAQILELLSSLISGSEDGLALTPKGMVAEGNKVAVEAESYGLLPNGRLYNNEYHFLFEIRGGKIASVKEYLDTMHTADVLR